MQLSFDLRMRPMSAGGRSVTVSPRMLIGVLALCGEKSIDWARQFASTACAGSILMPIFTPVDPAPESIDRRLGRLRRLYVPKKRRCRHVAAKLVEHLPERGGVRFAGVAVSQGNLPNGDFCQSLGFEPAVGSGFLHACTRSSSQTG